MRGLELRQVHGSAVSADSREFCKASESSPRVFWVRGVHERPRGRKLVVKRLYKDRGCEPVGCDFFLFFLFFATSLVSS